MSYGVIYGLTGNFKLSPNRTRLPIDRLEQAKGLSLNKGNDSFIVGNTGSHQIDLGLSILSPTNDVPLTVELWNLTRNGVVQARRSVAPGRTAPSDKHFGFEWDNPCISDEYAFFVTPESRAVNEFKLLTSGLNFRAVLQMFGGGGVIGKGTVGNHPKFIADHQIGDSLISESGSVISMAGGLAVAGPNNSTFIDLGDGQNAPAAPPNRCRLRYSMNRMEPEISVHGSPWRPLLSAQSIIIPIGDDNAPLSTGAAKATFRMPNRFFLTAIRASVSLAPVSGAVKIDIKQNGTTILKTPVFIDSGLKTSMASPNQPMISNSRLEDDAEMTVDILSVGGDITGAGLKLCLVGHRI